MSKSPQKHGKEDGVSIPLNTVPGLGGAQNNDSQVISIAGPCGASCCDDRNYRKLAICSIICGISCIGITALTNSVKAETATATDPENADKFSRLARKYGIISIVTWLTLLILTPILIILVSYLITLRD